MGLTYDQSVEQVRSWLSSMNLSSYSDTLLDLGYDHLDSISRCNQREMDDLLSLFSPGDDYKRARHLLQVLCGLLPAPPPHRHPSLTPPVPDSPPSSPSTANECRVGVRCPHLYGDIWVDRYIILDQAIIWCYPDDPVFIIIKDFHSDFSPSFVVFVQDQMPEFSADLSDWRTNIRRRDPTVISVAEQGKRQILMDFGSREVLDEWMKKISAIQETVDRNHDQGRNRADLQVNMKEILRKGEVFKKIKKGTASRRLVRCTRSLDKIMWGLPLDPDHIKGFIRIQGIDKVYSDLTVPRHLKLFIIGSNRSLTLESDEMGTIATWNDGLRWLLERRDQNNMQEQMRLQDQAERQKLVMRRQTCEDVLTAGDMFIKLKRGSSVPRKVSCTGDMQILQWKDEKKGRVKGQTNLTDIAFVQGDYSGKLNKRLKIVTKGRCIELEAIDERTRDVWVDMLSFWIRKMIRI